MTTTRYSGKSTYQRFTLDMEAAELHPYHYEGRFFYRGPAVTVDEKQDALSATKVPCQWDNLGLGYVVHPK